MVTSIADRFPGNREIIYGRYCGTFGTVVLRTKQILLAPWLLLFEGVSLENI